MTDDPTSDARSLALLLLAAAVGLVLFVPTASAQEASCTEVLENQSDVHNGSTAPGGLLADAIGDQRDEIGNELDEDGFEARLDNATSTRERARVIAAEVERIEANVSTIEQCWGTNGTEPVANRSLDELDASERATLENHTASLYDRLNATRNATDRLPRSVRSRHDVDARRLASLERRVLAVQNATTRSESAAADRFPF
ncbi:hypothetical protein SAMN05216559_0705 [Halomicrobium zhouii]|uniref:Uncharacterized protein n=1 Tax=Halomicrobium zhouii TaxID=767519 RepID=A0A1I6KF87_9EURY|nr:hypothetical protein [Halomicrobium zhouii]SFR89883.1 hypothetical protein SAMN05216559_0705 [Halomicrobium zhouii]